MSAATIAAFAGTVSPQLASMPPGQTVQVIVQHNPTLVGSWWNSPMQFWDDFSDDGQLAAEPAAHNAVGVLSLQRSLAAGASTDFTFLLAWRFPNRTPDWCGWKAPKDQGKTVIGNHYCTRFPTALAAVEYTAANLSRLESQTRLFAQAFRASTLPAVIKEAASANLSTLSTVCFRTADGEFHGFEGANDHLGCCFGNCTHVWPVELLLQKYHFICLFGESIP